MRSFLLRDCRLWSGTWGISIELGCAEVSDDRTHVMCSHDNSFPDVVEYHLPIFQQLKGPVSRNRTPHGLGRPASETCMISFAHQVKSWLEVFPGTGRSGILGCGMLGAAAFTIYDYHKIILFQGFGEKSYSLEHGLVNYILIFQDFIRRKDSCVPWHGILCHQVLHFVSSNTYSSG